MVQKSEEEQKSEKEKDEDFDGCNPRATSQPSIDVIFSASAHLRLDPKNKEPLDLAEKRTNGKKNR